MPLPYFDDLAREADSRRERYGANFFGHACLLARRLVEAGTRFVQVKWYDGPAFDAWDVHGADLGGMARMEQSLCPRLDQAEFSCTAPDIFAAGDRPRFERLRAAARRVTWGGDCYAYGLLALGLVDVVAESTLKLWDWAALVPVVEGAGGRVTDWEGRPLTPTSDGRVLAVGDPALLPEAVRLLGG